MLPSAFSVYGLKRWAATTRNLACRLEATRIDEKAQPLSALRYDAHELEGLPAPVQRYFRTVLKDGQPIITAVTIEWPGPSTCLPRASSGSRSRPGSGSSPVARASFGTPRSSMLPGVAVRVVDSYIAGKGLLHAAIQGLFTMAEVRGDGEIARGEFMRWFAEVALVPDRAAAQPGRAMGGGR